MEPATSASTASISATRLVVMVGTPEVDRPAYQWLSEAVRSLVADGRLLHGTRLPSERSMVAALGLSRTTVTRAYAELRDRGYATARQGSGTIAVLPGGPAAGGAEPVPMGVPGSAPAGAIDWRSAAPPAVAGLTSAYARAGEHIGRFVSGMGYFPVGIPEIREAVAQRYTERGLATSPDQIIVTTGATEGTAAAAQVLLGRGSRVIAETPAYPNSLVTLRREVSRVVPVPITWDGSDVGAWESATVGSGARAAFLTPDFHNPTGALLDAERRDQLAALWRRHKLTGLVDETLAELVIDDLTMPAPMAAFATSAVTVGSVSKMLWGGLRVAWIRAPRNLIGPLTQARMSIGLGGPVMEQMVAADLIRRGVGSDNERRDSLRSRRRVVMDGIHEALPDWTTVAPPGGLWLWWRLPVPRSTALVRAAREEGLLMLPGSTFAVAESGLEHWVRTPFALPEADLTEAVVRLARAWARVT
ncbi:PLP-dependent aminotransferase family protein [Demetria terragena]|uniref:MocR-like transcription factor YczR n=1 Tax=Demetria terragena TaxID=63959 RepID=UPI000366BA93|nr:PLP-dependent aminotransferase family protein [Demetria terragena]